MFAFARFNIFYFPVVAINWCLAPAKLHLIFKDPCRKSISSSNFHKASTLFEKSEETRPFFMYTALYPRNE
jgi:hypothetical protein